MSFRTGACAFKSIILITKQDKDNTRKRKQVNVSGNNYCKTLSTFLTNGTYTGLKKTRTLIVWNSQYISNIWNLHWSQKDQSANRVEFTLDTKLNTVSVTRHFTSPQEQTQAHGPTQRWTKFSFLWLEGLCVRYKTSITIKVIYGKYKQHNKWRRSEEMKAGQGQPLLRFIPHLCSYYFNL